MTSREPQAALRQSIELFYFAYRGFTTQADRILERRGLGRVHHRILYFVGRNPDTSVQGLLDILEVTKQALNAPLRQLIARALVSSTLAPHDHRVKRLRLTTAGARLEVSLTRRQMQHLQEVFKEVSAEAAAGWRQVMQVLADSRDLPERSDPSE